MKVESLIVNMMCENTYVVYDETGECVVIDCGCKSEAECESLAALIESRQLTVRHLLCTHLHLDHTFGNAFMRERYGVSAEASEADHLLAEMCHYQAIAFGIPDEEAEMETPLYTLKDGETVRFGETELEIIATPGHSPGGVSFYNKAEGVLFSGDTLMKNAIGATNLPGGRKSKLLKSIKERLMTLPDSTVVMPGHGEVTTIGEERANNPYLQDEGKA